MDLLIDDPGLTNAYLVKGADDVEEAVEAVLDHEPQYNTAAQSIVRFATDVDEHPHVLERDFPLGQPLTIDLAE